MLLSLRVDPWAGPPIIKITNSAGEWLKGQLIYGNECTADISYTETVQIRWFVNWLAQEKIQLKSSVRLQWRRRNMYHKWESNAEMNNVV